MGATQDKAGYKNLLADYRKGSVETIDGIKENRAPGGRLRIVGVPGVEKIYRVFADHSRKKRKEIDELDGLLKKDAESVTAYTKAVVSALRCFVVAKGLALAV